MLTETDIMVLYVMFVYLCLLAGAAGVVCFGIHLYETDFGTDIMVKRWKNNVVKFWGANNVDSH